jgi:hypothetical protein
MPKTVTVDFWDVLDMDGNPFDLFSVIEGASQLEVAARMKPRWAGQIDFLAEAFFLNQSSVSGTAVLIRTQDWPGRIHLETGALNALNLPTGEEVREDMSFVFDRSLQTLATQRQQLFRASRFANLLQDITRTPFIIQPKLREDAWERFERMTRIGKVEIKVQGPIHHPTFSRSTPSMAQLLDEAKNETNAIDIGLILSMGRARTSLARQRIRAVLNFFRRDGNAQSLTVTGNQADGPSETVDFINDRLVFSGEVDYAGKHLDRERCRQLLSQAMVEHRDYLVSTQRR